MGNIFCPPQKDGGDTPFVDDDESLYGESAGGSCYDAEQEEEDLLWTVHQLAQSRRCKRPLLLSPCSSAASCSALAGGADDDDEGAEDHRTPSPLPLPRPESIHLLAEHKNRSPFREYELLEVMGSGSMGEVSKVKRKAGTLRASKRCRVSGLTRSALSCSSLHSVDEISALGNFFGAEHNQGRGGSLLPTCRRRLAGGVIPPSLLGTGLTEMTTNSDDDEVSLALTSAPPSREASFRNNDNNRGVANPQSPRSLSPRETRPPRSGPPSRSPSPSYGMAGGRSSALLVMPETLTSTSAAAGGGFLALPRNMSFPCSQSAELQQRHQLPHAPWTGTFGFRRGKDGGSDASEEHRVYYALKSIHLRNLSSESYTIELRNEISILGSLDHPHIVRAIETYEHRRRLYLVLELCTGGDLYARDPYTEREAARIVGSVLSAVAYMHRKGIVHRDLKYENVMFVDTKPGADVKLIDFGLSKKYRPGDPYLKTGVGTIYSMAPEVFRGEYTSQADVWGVGVMAYMLLSSHLPFYGKNRQQIISRIVHGHYHFKGRSWKAATPSARDFVASLLRRDPDDRPTSAEALDLPWLLEKASKESAAASMAEPSKAAAMASCSEELADRPPPQEQEKGAERAAMSSLKNFAAYPALKKLALMVIAHRSTCMEIGFLQHIFHKLDVHRAGVVSKREFKARLAMFGYSAEELEPMFAGVDLGGCGLITYTEFLAATIESTGNITTARLTEAFDHFDNDGCGYISVSDLRAVLGKEIPRAYVDRVVDEADLTEDHRISFEEFLSLWC